MKNQNDLIGFIVAFVVLLIGFGMCMGMRPNPPAIAAPAPVNLAEPQLPAELTVMADSLPGGTASGPGSGFGGAMGMGGPMSGMRGGPMSMGAAGSGGPRMMGAAGSGGGAAPPGGGPVPPRNKKGPGGFGAS